MKRLIGFALFWIGVGMLIMLFLRSAILKAIICLIFLLIGYNLFTCK